jgi:hypothetical protein
MGLHFVEGLALFFGQDLAQLLLHLLVEGLHLGEIRAQDGFELGTITLGDRARFRLLVRRELQGSGRARQERRRPWWRWRQVVPAG